MLKDIINLKVLIDRLLDQTIKVIGQELIRVSNAVHKALFTDYGGLKPKVTFVEPIYKVNSLSHSESEEEEALNKQLYAIRTLSVKVNLRGSTVDALWDNRSEINILDEDTF